MAAGGEVLAPEPRDQPVQWIDVRDLAAWILRMAERRAAGVFNATGPVTTMEAFLTGIRDATGGNAELTWVDERFLIDAGVDPFQELPLWLAPNVDPDWACFLSLDPSKAVEAGLSCRPLAETVRDTLAWARAAPAQGPKDVGVEMAPAGISPERERGAPRALAKAGRVSTVAFDVEAIRARFSALDGPTAFFDGPGGTQVPDSVVEAIAAYLRESNANLGGPFATSRASDALFVEARDGRRAVPRRLARTRSASART